MEKSFDHGLLPTAGGMDVAEATAECKNQEVLKDLELFKPRNQDSAEEKRVSRVGDRALEKDWKEMKELVWFR